MTSYVLLRRLTVNNERGPLIYTLSLPSPFPPTPYPLSSPQPLPFPSLPLEVGPLKSSWGVWGSAVSSPSGVWGGAPAETEFGAFQP